MVKSSSIDAADVYQTNADAAASSNSSIRVKELSACAIYFIPAMTSDLYKFGSEILGYDVRQRMRIQTERRDQVGDAANFGFHLTLADALYFYNTYEVDFIVEELKHLCKDMDAFEITNMRVKGSFPDNRSIAISLDDPSGSLEAIHFELVNRIYRRAAASNYTLENAHRERDQNLARADFMIGRYKAPYILGSYTPHFSLLTNVAQEEMEATLADVEEEFKKAVKRPRLRVDRLAVMKRPDPTEPWQIAQEIEIRRR